MMSMILASGAMPTITARQIAAASFAVPKSVINTMVFRAAAAAALASLAAASFCAGDCLAQPAKLKLVVKIMKGNRIVWK